MHKFSAVYVRVLSISASFGYGACMKFGRATLRRIYEESIPNPPPVLMGNATATTRGTAKCLLRTILVEITSALLHACYLCHLSSRRLMSHGSKSICAQVGYFAFQACVHPNRQRYYGSGSKGTVLA